MVQEYGIDTICITEKLKPRSAIKGTLRGVRGGVKSPYSIAVRFSSLRFRNRLISWSFGFSIRFFRQHKL